ncbi:LuxR family transcriptional regulator [uncultured Roseobacter sp.]|uniref:helix-turn-helix transcriptional regulator n=1 Tax=uncultured Roseobacter sp. TaxID=114847 RepID=UPI002639064E|nr:LuxR family transcriptional regulator [uncultured Roseobacter sp.]
MVTTTLAEQILEGLEQADTLEKLYQVTYSMRDGYDVKHVVYYWVNSVGENYGAGTYSPEWTERYVEKGYNKIDPVVMGCFQRFDPVNWKDLDWSSKPVKEFLKDALDHGVGAQGIAIPLRGPSGQYAVLSINDNRADDEWDAFVREHKRDFMIIAYEFNKKGLEFEEQGHDKMLGKLSPRELSALTYLARGLSRTQAAHQMKISEHTLRVYIESARHKLGALNTTHAVARAIHSGLIVA